VNDHRHYPGSAENWQQVGSCPLTYTGEPLVFEVDLPKDGLLQPLGAPPPGEKGMQAYYVQWFLEVDGEVMRSPVAMLRY
jgi:hypothetical protein